jgi:CDP-glucose 4,6-dehydratase
MEALVAADPDFWSERTVFVTGHTGFKGAWLTLWLQHLGADVYGYSLGPPTVPSLYVAADLENTAPGTVGDVADIAGVARAMASVEPTIVFHLAAQALVRESYEHPVETLVTNVIGTAVVLEAVRGVGSIESVVVVTSDKCYENREWPWAYRESDPLGGHDPYSASKGCAELVTAAWRRSFLDTIGVASARAGNVIGGGDWAHDRLLPDCIRALTNGEAVRVRNPRSVRPWQHVLEPLLGYLMLAERLCEDGRQWGTSWNFGPAESEVRSAEWIASEVARRWGTPDAWVASADTGPHEAASLRLDASRARGALGWAPRLSVEDALDWTVEWYRRYDEGADPRVLTLQQIEQYEGLKAIR